jgi:hypothetical protein
MVCYYLNVQFQGQRVKILLQILPLSGLGSSFVHGSRILRQVHENKQLFLAGNWNSKTAKLFLPIMWKRQICILKFLKMKWSPLQGHWRGEGKETEDIKIKQSY